MHGVSKPKYIDVFGIKIIYFKKINKGNSHAQTKIQLALEKIDILVLM
jgi:hypothetical protein